MADKRRRPRSAMVTGAAQGIGRAIALQLATDGFDVTVADLPALRSLAEDTATSIRALGRKAHVSLADISDRGEAERMCAEHLDALDPIWCMVANAGIAQVKPVMELTEQDVRKTFDVNVFGMFNCFQVAAKHMIEQGGGGRLLAASSVAGHQANARLVHYGASKFAVRGLCQGMAKELAPHGILVNAYCPGIIHTAMQDAVDEGYGEGSGRAKGDTVKMHVEERVALKRPGYPEDVARVVGFLAGDGASYITGQSINIDGGIIFT